MPHRHHRAGRGMGKSRLEFTGNIYVSYIHEATYMMSEQILDMFKFSSECEATALSMPYTWQSVSPKSCRITVSDQGIEVTSGGMKTLAGCCAINSRVWGDPGLDNVAPVHMRIIKASHWQAEVIVEYISICTNPNWESPPLPQTCCIISRCPTIDCGVCCGSCMAPNQPSLKLAPASPLMVSVRQHHVMLSWVDQFILH